MRRLIFGGLALALSLTLPVGLASQRARVLKQIDVPHDYYYREMYLPQATSGPGAAAWSPDPQSPPLYLQLPTKDGVPQPDVLAKWAANAPLAFLDQYVGSLRLYRAIALDVGDQDRLKDDTARLHEALDRYGIAHGFEVYAGTHTSKVADRVQNHVLPFFHRTLCADKACK